MEAVKEGRLIIVRVPLEGGGRLVVSVNDAEAKVVVTADGQWRRGKAAPLKPAVDAALEGDSTPVEKVLVVKRTESDVAWTEGRDIWWHDLVDGQSTALQEMVEIYTKAICG